MKIQATLFVLSIALTAFSPTDRNEKVSVKACRQLALNVFDALVHESAQAYLVNFPSLEEFQQGMETHADAYGPYLHDAKLEFGEKYYSAIVPKVESSFMALLTEGKRRNIDWGTIQLVRIEAPKENPTASFTLVIDAHGKQYRIVFDRLLALGGQLKVSQYVKLM